MVARTRVKVCGVTSVDQAQAIVDAGIDAIGLVFYTKSPRAVDIDTAKAICQSLPPFVQKVGLFVNPERGEVHAILDEVSLDILQFHGDETDEFCRQFGRAYMKALPVKDRESIEKNMHAFPGAVGLLLDAYQPDLYGGTGQQFNWDDFPKHSDKPLILAGGLDADNVAQAIVTCHPYAVDVSSGVEVSKGIKSLEKVHAFVKAVNS
ncbi:MAG: phosphoribosylanthranilate isomerase [Cellvibrionales bacterium]|nr:phosphoribosylanthranilate isomerase [Cellvibrionales bacterium]